MLCSVCTDEIHQGDEINCTKCYEFIHFNCAGLREVNFRKMSTSLKEKWSCSNCKVKKVVTAPAVTKPITDETLQNVVDAVNFMSSQFDDFSLKLKQLISTVNDLKNENKRIVEENAFLKKEMVAVSGRLNKLEQKSLECLMEIVGVPEIDNENCMNTIKKIVTKVGSDVTIKKVFRLPSKFNDKPRKLSVCFNSLNEKNNFMEIAKKQKLAVKDVDSTWIGSTIYFNDQMTYTFRNLFFKTKTAAKQVGYKYVWFKNNTIFCKKNENSKLIIIDNETSITKIV